MIARYELINYKDEMYVHYHAMNYIKASTHWHTELEILFVFKGQLRLTIDGQDYMLSSQEFAVINSGQIHSCESVTSNQCQYSLLQINSQFFKNLHIDVQNTFYRNLYSCNAESEFYHSHCSETFKLTSKIESALDAKADGYVADITLACCQVLTNLQNNTEHIEKSKASDVSLQNTDRMKRVLNYIDNHYADVLSIEDVAQIEHISIYYLSHLFKKYTTASFSQYINHYRVEKAKYDLTHTTDSITDIYFRHGFNNGKTFNRVFRNICGCSPTEFRSNNSHEETTTGAKQNQKDVVDTGIGTYIKYHPNSNVINQSYALPALPNELHEPVPDSVKQLSISSSYTDCDIFFHKFYTDATGTGRANDFLKANFQNQFRHVQSTFHFNYIRFFGIFDHDMDIIRKENGQFYFNFYQTDMVIDFILSNSCRPYLVLGFMPDILKSTEDTIYYYRANVSPPVNLQDWTTLLERFMDHLLTRYGFEEVSSWIFEVWNEPDIDFWTGTFSQYLELYKISFQTVKSWCPSLKIGGPALSSNAFEHPDCLNSFLDYCNKNDIVPDFISLHPYPVKLELVPGSAKVKMVQLSRDNLSENIDFIKTILSSQNYSSVPLHLNEWNSTPDITDLAHDTAFMATFIIHNVISNMNSIDLLCYWCISDLIDELGVPRHELCGSFGLMTRSGLKKPSFWGLWALNSLTEHCIAKADNYIITKSENSLQVLLWNYCHYNEQYSSGDYSKLTYYDRYKVFEEAAPIHFSITINELPFTICEITKFEFDRQHGSIFDLWIANGAPEYFSAKQLAFFKEHNHLAETHSYRPVSENKLTLKTDVAPFGFTLFEIKKATGA